MARKLIFLWPQIVFIMKLNKTAIIIGTQKGGTTSLFNYLSQHPQISESKVKETNFFLKDSQWDRGLEYYKNLWEWDSQKHLTALEASPNYTNSLKNASKVIQRIQTIDATFKFIYILRDPIKKIESMRKQGVYQGWYARRLEKETPDSVPLEVIECVSYAKIADKFVKAFSKENVLLIEMSALINKASSSQLMSKICQFLEIDSSFEFELEKVHNSQGSYRKDTLWNYFQRSKYLSFLKNIFSDPIKNNARRILSRSWKNKEEVLPLTEGQKDFIQAALQDEMLRLRSEYGLALANWNIRR
ncbi:MAG: sulfotransferase domain-containing protein [Cyanobacteria bacterium P01_D01_bin.44]